MGRLVYYVEDDTSIRELVLYALKTSDFQVMGFEDAASFYQHLLSSSLHPKMFRTHHRYSSPSSDI